MVAKEFYKNHCKIAGKEVSLHVNGIHTAPILTFDFMEATDECDKIATRIAYAFEGEILFCDKTKHIVIKTKKEVFEGFVLKFIGELL